MGKPNPSKDGGHWGRVLRTFSNGSLAFDPVAPQDSTPVLAPISSSRPGTGVSASTTLKVVAAGRPCDGSTFDRRHQRMPSRGYKLAWRRQRGHLQARPVFSPYFLGDAVTDGGEKCPHVLSATNDRRQPHGSSKLGRRNFRVKGNVVTWNKGRPAAFRAIG